MNDDFHLYPATTTDHICAVLEPIVEIQYIADPVGLEYRAARDFSFCCFVHDSISLDVLEAWKEQAIRLVRPLPVAACFE